MGRLGNWCFQFSATYTLARQLGVGCRMPLRSQNEMLWPTPKFPKVIYGGPLPGKLYNEPHHHYAELPKEDGLILNGYWQSYKYFADYEVEIANVLDFPADKLDAVAVHVRRGDYLQFPDQFPVLPVEYYNQAIEVMREKGYSDFAFYTDDLTWCQQTFKGDNFYFFKGAPLHDMKSIYKSNAVIISNSSFSLFPALLSKNNNVIAPAEHRWYGEKNKHLLSIDMMRENWIKI